MAIALITAYRLLLPLDQTPAPSGLTERVVRIGTIQKSVTLTGVLSPRLRTNVASAAGGLVTKVLVGEGQQVRIGQALIQLDTRRLVVEVERRRLALQRAQRPSKATVSTELDSSALDLASARLELKQAQEALDDATLRSPIPGRVTRITAREGEFAPGASAGRPTVIIAGSDEYVAVVEASEFDVANVRRDGQAQIYIEAVSTASVAGIVLADPSVKRPRDHQMNREAAFEFEVLLKSQPPPGSLAGMTARVEIEVAKKESVPLVPLDAVMSERGGHYVLVSLGSSTRPVPVMLGVSDDMNVEIVRGLRVGARVMTGSNAMLRLKAWPSS